MLDLSSQKNSVFWGAHIKQVQEMGVISGMNGVAVARHGPILWENDATGSSKLSRHLPGPPGAVGGPKTAKKMKIRKKQFFCIYLYINSRYTALGG